MDSDILEGLPTTEELEAAGTPDTIPPEALTTAPPALPVDADSIEPAPQTVAAPVQEEPVTSVLASSEEQGTIPDMNKVEALPREDLIKSAATPGATSHIPDGPRVDVSAATVARMMGIASTSDLRLLEGRVDLLTSKVAAILTKMDRCLSMFGSIPTASDIGRLEVQVAAIKSMMRELLDSVGAPMSSGKDQADRATAQEQSRKLREGIKTNTES
jgi:hypothetical protein